MKIRPHPLLLEPVYKDYIWGGTRISRLFGRTPRHRRCAESWEVADRSDGMSIVRNGPLAGTTLRELVRTGADELIGADSGCTAFPLLIKIIDASQRLSVQVHPHDRTGGSRGAEPKTEAWYVLDGHPAAKVFAGLKPGTDAAAFCQALDRGRVEDLLCPLPARPGDAILVPGGLVHAVGEGCLLLEVQQNSNTTYRVYDWGRVGENGKPRELHIEQAMEVIRWDAVATPGSQPARFERVGRNIWEDLLSCAHFRMQRVELREQQEVPGISRSFQICFTLAGKVQLAANGITVETDPGTSCLLPAALSSYTAAPLTAEAALIRVTLGTEAF